MELSSKSKEIGFLLQQFDQAIRAFRSTSARSENAASVRKAEAAKKLLEQLSAKHEQRLVLLLQDEAPRARWISAAALGFCGDPNIVGAIDKALMDRVPRVRESAAFGLGVLALPYTPLERLNRLVLDEKENEFVRKSAAWALVRLQLAKAPPKNFAALWPEVLKGDPLRKDPVLCMHALRGLGLLRSEDNLGTLRPYLSHPTPLLRQAALIAVGRTGSKRAARWILPFLTPEERVPNVRLTARKALKQLTGNRVDHEFDLDAWKREFGLLEEKKGNG